MVNNILRDSDGVAHVVGVSGGKDSTCLALALKEKEPRPYTYFYTPTGDELPEMKEHILYLSKLLDSPILQITNGTLASAIIDNKMLPSFHARFCTRVLKVTPARLFFKGIVPVVSYVGLRADEAKREGIRLGRQGVLSDSNIIQRTPFQTWGWDIDDVWRYLEDKHISIPERTDCARCPYQKIGEWYNLWQNHSDIYANAEKDELVWEHTFRSPGRDTWPADLSSLRLLFEKGHIPSRSLKMMETRKGMCRTCSF